MDSYIKGLMGGAAAYAAGAPAQEAFSLLCREPAPQAAADAPVLPDAAALENILAAAKTEEEAMRRVSLYYALLAVLPVYARLVWPEAAGVRMKALYPARAEKEKLLAVLDQLEGLQRSCLALPEGSFRMVRAEGDILHFTRSGKGEILDAVFNTGVSPCIAEIGGKAVEVNGRGYTLTVREAGHSPDHSYYDIG